MIERYGQSNRMSQAVIYPASASVILLAGQVADNRHADVGGQTADVLAKIDRLLA